MPVSEEFKARWRGRLQQARDHVRIRAAGLGALARPSRRIVTIAGWTVLALIIAWFLVLLALTNPRIATPLANWGLHTFAAKSANVASARLRHVFSTTFDVRGLDWPDRASAEEMALKVNLLGWLPGVPWLDLFAARSGGFAIPSSGGKSGAFGPQAIVDRIDLKDINLSFVRRGTVRTIVLVSASGSLSKGTVQAEATAGASRLTFDGLAGRGATLTGHVTARGENAAALAEYAGVTSPDTPPFDVSGDLTVRRKSWSFAGIAGRIGDSAVTGTTVVELRPERPFVDANLTFASLDFDDLGVVFGIPTGAGKGETTNQKQRDTKTAYDRSARLIPDARIDLRRLAAVDARFTVSAQKVVDAPFGIDSVEIMGDLDDRLLTFSTLTLGSGKGGLTAKATVNARQDPAHTEASGELKGVPVSRFVTTRFVDGDLSGAFALKMDGSGFREAFASATGEVGLWSPNARLAKIAVEGAGLDIGEALLSYFGGGLKNPDYFETRCAVANFALKNGEASLSPGIIDTSDSLINITGGFSLKSEGIDMKVKTRPKDVSFGNLSGDIGIGGTLRRPSVDLLDSDTLVQAGLMVLLSSIAGPLGALPFIETGDGDDAPCRSLLAEARTANRNGAAEPSPLDANRVVRPG